MIAQSRRSEQVITSKPPDWRVRGLWSSLRAGGVVASLAVASLQLAPQAVLAADPTSPRIMVVNQPDVVGGYESSYVIARLQGGTQPVKLADGRWTIKPKDQAATAIDADAKSLANVFQRRQVKAITPLFPGPYLNPKRAAELGLDRWHKLTIPRGSNAPAVAAEFKNSSARIEVAQA